MKNEIAREFNFASLLRFTLPNAAMMMFMSLYTIVDGVFVSKFVGTDALSAINIVYPLLTVTLAVGIMLATGGSAVIARKQGEGKEKEARSDFSMILGAGVLVGIVYGIVLILLHGPLSHFMGANEILLPYCTQYLIILAAFMPFNVLQLLFQTFFVTAGKPGYGLFWTVVSGAANIVLDYIFIVPLDMGIAGAAWGTAISYVIPSIAGIVYFLRQDKPLYIVKPKWDWRALGQSCFNGSSEMVTQLSSAVITFVFNLTMMHFLGSDGVAAVTIVLYSHFLFTALYLGFSGGVAPIFSYNYGSGNHGQLKRVFKYCMIFIGSLSILLPVLSVVLAKPIVSTFTPVGTNTYRIAVEGFYLFAATYLFVGVNIFSSSLFTALSNGAISAVISFLRTFGFILPSALLLPILFQEYGIWLATPVAEIAALVVSVCFLFFQRKRYHYL
jgi:putative MATE family efflux protein